LKCGAERIARGEVADLSAAFVHLAGDIVAARNGWLAVGANRITLWFEDDQPAAAIAREMTGEAATRVAHRDLAVVHDLANAFAADGFDHAEGDRARRCLRRSLRALRARGRGAERKREREQQLAQDRKSVV